MSLSPTDRNFRLPEAVRPTRYEVFLSIDLEGRTFSGRIRVSLALGSRVDGIAIHSAGLEIVRATVSAGGEAREASVSTFAASETILLSTGAPLPAGPADVNLEWNGRFSAGLRGLYRAGPLAATQFEAADARRVFPCLDEPGFKAPWSVAVEIPPGTPVLANGREVRRVLRGEREEVTFAETPPLPTYLVALVAGRVDAHPPVTVRGVPVRTWAQPEKLPLTGFGQDVAVEVLPRLEDYFGVPYAFGKLDQAGLPEFEAGAMENAGLVTYREVALLLDPATASLAL
jgi:puromycin-sensitive aminopeptidase